MTDTPNPAQLALAWQAFVRSTDNQLPITHVAPDPRLIACLERALLALPRTTRDVFLANRLDQLSYAEITEKTGLSVARVRRHVADAMDHTLRQLNGD